MDAWMHADGSPQIDRRTYSMNGTQTESNVALLLGLTQCHKHATGTGSGHETDHAHKERGQGNRGHLVGHARVIHERGSQCLNSNDGQNVEAAQQCAGGRAW